jgi:hypothetical protein
MKGNVDPEYRVRTFEILIAEAQNSRLRRGSFGSYCEPHFAAETEIIRSGISNIHNMQSRADILQPARQWYRLLVKVPYIYYYSCCCFGEELSA